MATAEFTRLGTAVARWNWIGASDSPVDAVYISPPPTEVAGSRRNRMWRADEPHRLLDEYGAGFDCDIDL